MTGAPMLDPLLPESKKTLAAGIVANLYAGFDVERLENILAIGRTYEAGGHEEVLLLNEALAALIGEKRKAER